MKTIKRWDFGNQELLSDKQKTLFIRLHGVFIKTFESILWSMFAAKTGVAVTKCDQCKYDEFLGKNEKFTFMLEEIAEIQGRQYTIFLDIDPLFYSMILDKLLGGKAKNINKIDRITEIEETMLVKKFDEIFRQLFQKTKNKSVIVSSFLEASALGDNLNGNGIVVTVNIAIDNVKSGIKIFYPADFIQGLITKG